MSGQVTISIWLFVFLLAICAWAVLERILIPSSRWFIRRKINRVIDEISARLDIQIKQVIPALPISLVATVMLESGHQGLGALEVEARVNQLIEKLQGRGAHVYVSPRNRVESILSALNMLQLRKLVRESGGTYRIVPEETGVLAYYANAIAHWWQNSDVSIDPGKQNIKTN